VYTEYTVLTLQCSQNELTNGVINACFLLLFKDLIRLFACYNDGVINLLGNVFLYSLNAYLSSVLPPSGRLLAPSMEGVWLGLGQVKDN